MLFIDKPAKFKPDFEIVSLIIEHNGQILLLHRHPHKSQGNKWGVPAGKVEANETLEESLAREVYEETGLKNVNEKGTRFFNTVFVEHPEHTFIYHMYHLELPTLPNIVINPDEHQSFKWVTPIEALKMNLIDDEDECIKMYYNLK
jgi:8-oxo-dGTP diphosphatase